MSDENSAAGAVDTGTEREAYTYRGNTALEAEFARRSGAVEARFILPHLRPGMRLLDCGSGPGSITCDLAEVVAPGEVVGLDIQPEQAERARLLAQERGLSNVRFETGSIYALPFTDASFDAAFAHQVLIHLGDPGAALREIRRVLKPGGVVGIRDLNFDLVRYSPPNPLLDAYTALRIRALQHNGGSPLYALHQRQLLLEAGFARSEARAEVDEQRGGTLAKTRRSAEFLVTLLRGKAFRETVIGQGWAGQADLDAMEAEVLAWGERSDAFGLAVFCMAIGWNQE